MPHQFLVTVMKKIVCHDLLVWRSKAMQFLSNKCCVRWALWSLCLRYDSWHSSIDKTPHHNISNSSSNFHFCLSFLECSTLWLWTLICLSPLPPQKLTLRLSSLLGFSSPHSSCFEATVHPWAWWCRENIQGDLHTDTLVSQGCYHLCVYVEQSGGRKQRSGGSMQEVQGTGGCQCPESAVTSCAKWILLVA